MKALLFIPMLFFVASSTNAATVLEQLPFGIKLGITKNSEIESRGVCVKRIQLTDRYFRCEVYDMVRGQFVVASSESEVVSQVYFDAHQEHSLPSAWKKLGINFPKCTKGSRNNCLSYDEDGKYQIGLTTLSQLMDIIKGMGARNIEVIRPANSDMWKWIDVSALIGDYNYKFSFLALGSERPSQPPILFIISVTESY